MGTTLDRASELRDNITAVANALDPVVILPERTYSIVGTPQPTCDSVITAVTNLTPLDNASKCPPQMTQIMGLIAREFSCWDNQGMDIPSEIEAASMQMALDGDVLWSAAFAMEFGAQDVSVAFSTIETLWIASVQLLVPVL